LRINLKEKSEPRQGWIFHFLLLKGKEAISHAEEESNPEKEIDPCGVFAKEIDIHFV
jgi:hypothetical protein